MTSIDYLVDSDKYVDLMEPEIKSQPNEEFSDLTYWRPPNFNRGISILENIQEEKNSIKSVKESVKTVEVVVKEKLEKIEEFIQPKISNTKCKDTVDKGMFNMNSL